MSVMIIVSPVNLYRVSKEVQCLIIDNIYFYNANNTSSFMSPINGLVPFVDVLVLGKEAVNLEDVSRLLDDAISRNIPVISKGCVGQLKNFYKLSDIEFHMHEKTC